MTVKMAAAILALSLIACVLTPTRALQVTPNSVCAKVCIDNPSADVSDPNVSNTYGQDIVCNDNDYVSMPVGQKFRQCLDCLQNSTASSTTENDQAWFLYNLRYAFNTCVFAAANASDPISTPCSTDTVCAPLQSALEQGMSSPSTMDQYGYCSANSNAFLGPNLNACEECLRENNEVYYLSNFLVALDAGCIQQPPVGTLVGLNGTLFQTNQVAIVAPVTSSTAQKKKSKPLTIGAIIGIAVGGAVLLLILGATVFVCRRKRRNARRLKLIQSPLDERFGAPEISAPNKGAFASPQISPELDKESTNLQMKRSPKIRNFSFSSQQPLRAGEWTGSSSTSSTPATVIAASPPGYAPSNRSARDSIPTHHAYISPEYSPPSRNSISPNYVSTQPVRPPSAPPQHIAQDSPSSFTTHRTPPSVTSIRTKTPVNGTNATSPPLPGQTIPRSSSRTGFRTTTPAPPPISISRTPSRMQNRSTIEPNTIGAVDISGPIIKVGSRFENEEEARKARERLYREGLLGRTMVHGKDEEARDKSPDRASESEGEELWPGSY